ncbi:MAG: hypothetical protein GX799_00130 [Crenarchaeota archaeon]|nr:hypothetical protein [Thermoproteota archaeon]
MAIPIGLSNLSDGVWNCDMLDVSQCINANLNKLSKVSNITTMILKDDSKVSSYAKTETCPLYYFRQIISRLIENDVQIAIRFGFYTQPDDRSNVQLENINVLSKSFADYIDLVTATRQFVDSLVTDSYQLICLEPKKLNYQALSSLSSF